jgi:adenosylmethionine-8-amino-7-oxononanoate aminotransferase
MGAKSAQKGQAQQSHEQEQSQQIAELQAQQSAQQAAAQAPPPQAAAAAPSAPAEPDYMAELEKLSQLKNAGVITEDEFQAKKAQILGI